MDVFSNYHQTPIETLKTEGKLTGPSKNLYRLPDDTDHRESTKIITTNVIGATANTSEPTNSLNEDSIAWNISAMRNQIPVSKLPYAIDIALNRESLQVAAFSCRPTYHVRMLIDN